MITGSIWKPATPPFRFTSLIQNRATSRDGLSITDKCPVSDHKSPTFNRGPRPMKTSLLMSSAHARRASEGARIWPAEQAASARK